MPSSHRALIAPRIAMALCAQVGTFRSISNGERGLAGLVLAHELACVTVTRRERSEDLTVLLRVLPETAVWGESRWDEAVWGGPLPELWVLGETALGDGVLAKEGDGDLMEQALAIISNGSFPAPGRRDHLKKGQEHQLRDAMIFEAHVRHRRHVLVTADAKAFVNGGRRERLQRLGRTRILTLRELEQVAGAAQLESLRSPPAITK